ncbi:uncharacterized protein LOC102453937 isoform X4 [Pelodiscus sinensis]|uniref:uncharacterized protein LOC102453937 isoform X4 n=1 Tax=Pelodiscus sinensis TaxID=13735 RepID=UPI003F6CBA81
MLDVLACPQYPLPLPRGQAQSAVPCICRGVSAPGPRTLLMVHSHRNKRLEQPLKESQAGTVQLHRHPGPPALCHPLARRHPLVPLHCPAGSCEGLSRPAMLLLGCSSKLWLLEGMLRRGLPDTLPVTRICPCSRERTGKVPRWLLGHIWGWGEGPSLGRAAVYGAVMHVNRGNPARSEVLVDSWPEFKIVLTRPQRAVAWERNDYGTNLYAAFYRDEGACRALLANTQAVDWGQAFQMQGEPLLPHGPPTTTQPPARGVRDHQRHCQGQGARAGDVSVPAVAAPRPARPATGAAQRGVQAGPRVPRPRPAAQRRLDVRREQLEPVLREPPDP